MIRISANTLAELYRKAAEQFDTLPAFAAKDASSTYQPIPHRQLYEDGLSLATSLIQLGLRPREHVAIFSTIGRNGFSATTECSWRVALMFPAARM